MIRKMLKKLFPPAAASALALFASCGETVVESGKDSGKPAGQDTVTVSDTLTSQDTLAIPDTLIVPDTPVTSDTIAVSDTVIVLDTIRVIDTVIVKDTVFGDPDLSEISVTGLTHVDLDSVNINSTQALLRWNMMEGADYYKIFTKKSTDSEFKPAVDYFIDTTGYFYFERISYYSSYYYESIKNNVFTIAVQAANSRSQSKLATVEVSAKLTQQNQIKAPNDSVCIFDPHALSLSSGVTLKNFMNVLLKRDSPRPDTVANHHIYFSEPINTNGVRFKFEPEIPRLYISCEWDNSRTTLVLFLIVLPGYAITEDINTIFTISGIRSESGKDFIIGYTINGERIIKNTMDFRFATDPPD